MRKYSVLSALAAVAVMAMIAAAVPSNGQAADVEVVEVSGGAFGLTGEISSDVLTDLSPDALAATLQPIVQAAADDDAAAAQAAVEGIDLEATNAEAVLASLPPTPEVILPPEGGGPFTDELANITVGSELLADLGSVSTEGSLGPDGAVASSAELAGYNMFVLGGRLVSSECTADLEGTAGSATLIEAGGILSGEFPENPEPNTESPFNIDVRLPIGPGYIDVVYITTLNEQFTTGTELTVNAMHSILSIHVDEDGTAGPAPELAIFDADITASQSRCGVIEAEIVEPTPDEPDAVPDVVEATPPFTG